MRQRREECDVLEANAKGLAPRRPPPPPPLPRAGAEESFTRREIARFWRQKRIEEEDHLLAAIKAAARLRARNLTEQDYLRFEESCLKTDQNDGDIDPKEVRVGIIDWWTKSKYAYLNQPALLESMDPPNSKKRTATYVPTCLSYNPKPLYPTSISAF